MATKKKAKPAKKAAKKSAPKKSTAKKTAKKAEPKAEKKKPLPVGKGKLGFTVSNTFNQPLAKVWDGATKGKLLEKYFVDKVTGELAKDKHVTWSWGKYGEGTCNVVSYKKNKEAVFTWDSMSGGYQVTCRFEILKKDKTVILRVHESGYQEKDLKYAFMMAEGWAEFLCYLKAYLKFGVDVMRKG